MKQTKKWKQAKITLSIVFLFIAFLIGYDFVDPFISTNKTVDAVVIRSVQKVERYNNHKEIVVEINSGKKFTFRVLPNSNYYYGARIRLKIMERSLSGARKYVL